MSERAGPSEDELLASVTARSKSSLSLLKSDKVLALSCALASPPTSSKVVETKDLNAATVASVLSAIPDSDMDKCVDGITLEECDILLKYLYRMLGDASNTDKNGQILKWHAKVSGKTGPGGIVRVMADRKTV